jgi:hypothetical protein
VADSRAEFSSSEQGKNNWYYGYTKALGDKFNLMSHYDPKNGWVPDAKGGYPDINAHGGHPSSGKGLCVRRWLSEVEGEIRIEGNLAKTDGNPASDGVTGYIRVDGRDIWSQHVGGRDKVGVWYDVTTDVKARSTVDFFIFSGPRSWADSSKFTATIYVSEG